MAIPYRDNDSSHAPISGQMFGGFAAAQERKAPKWAAPLLGGAVFIHLVIFGTMWIKSIWAIEQLEPPKSSIDLAMAPPPPPPPPPPPGGAKPQNVVITPKKIKVKDIVQPVKIEKKQEQVQEVSNDPAGEVGGEVGGVAGGVAGGVVGAPAAPPPPPPPPPPAPPKNVAPAMLEANRISGDKNIVPDDPTKTEIQRSGKDKLVASFKLCISLTGTIAAVNMLKSSGFPAYDGKIQREMRTWRYKPFEIEGKAVPACTAVTFIYSQQ